MSRGVTCLALLVTAGVLTCAAAPAPIKPAGKEAPKLSPTLMDVLGKVVNYGGLDDPKATLEDALEHLSKVHRFTFDINKDAFKAEGLNDVAKVEIAATPIEPMEGVLVWVVLEEILRRVPARSGATWRIRGHHVEITTRMAPPRKESKSP